MYSILTYSIIKYIDMSYFSEKQAQGNKKLRMIARVKKYTDCVIIILALGALLCNLILPLTPCVNNAICITLGVIGFIYVLRVICLWSQKPRLDWFLIHGHFLRKVVCIVLLMPFLLTAISQIFISSPKELAYEQGLYECNDKELPCSIKREQESPNMFWSTYYHFVDPGNQHMTTTKSGRAFAAIVSILGILLLNGLLVSSLIGWFDNRKERWLNGKVKYPGFLRRNQHYVIIGGNDMVASIVCQLFDHCEQTSVSNDSAIAKSSSSENNGQSEEKSTSLIQNLINWLKGIFSSKPYILIQTSRDVESFRRELFSELPVDRQRRVIIYYGNRTSADDIEGLILESAKEVYILGEDTRTDDIESYHDTMNMECLKLICINIQDIERFNKINDKLICRVMFEYQTTFNILQITDINNIDKIKFYPFNKHEMWAQKVLVCPKLVADRSQYTYLPLEDIDGIGKDSTKFVHLVIVGMSRMGVAMAIEAAHLSHYPNFETNKKRTRITFIDPAMEKEKYFFMGRFKEMFSVARFREVDIDMNDIYNNTLIYPWVDPLNDKNSKYKGNYLGDNFVDIEWEFVNGSIEHPNVQKYLDDAAQNNDAKLTIAVCLPENNRAIAAASYLSSSIYESENTLQILVYQSLNQTLLRQLNSNKYCNKLKAFGMTRDCYDLSLQSNAERIVDYIGNEYDQYFWELTINRYIQGCLIEDDYERLSGKQFIKNVQSQEDIKQICEVWLANLTRRFNGMVKNYSKDIREEEKCLIKDIKEKFGAVTHSDNEHNHHSKPVSAKMWSNFYNIYTIWSKLRCIGETSTDNVQDIVNRNDVLELLGKVEHNRWVVEQLLLRYRPLKKEEQDKAKILRITDSMYYKDKYKKEKYGHLDICSNERLSEIDYMVINLDIYLTKVALLRCKDWKND